MRKRGEGYKYEKPRKGGVWWIKVSDHGKVYRESTGLKGAAGEKKADRLLSRYTEDIEKGIFDPTHARAKGVTFEDLSQMLTDEYEANGRKSIDKVRISLRHLEDRFKGKRVAEIAPKIPAYIAFRKGEGAANATIRLELAAIKRAINLAYQAEMIPNRPYIGTIAVRNTRTGFFEADQLASVLKHLPSYLVPVTRFAALTGWRKSEILSLRWAQVDFKAETVRLEAGNTKNDDARTYPFSNDPDLRALLKEQREHTSALERAYGSIIPTVFHNDGKQITHYDKAWETATKKAGIPDRLFHDLRRTAVRNLERASVPRSVAMRLTGHRTEAVYRRYAIVSEKDLGEGIAKLYQDRTTASTKREA
jgi:integrase